MPSQRFHACGAVQDWAQRHCVSLDTPIAGYPGAAVAAADEEDADIDDGNIADGHDEIVWAIQKHGRRFFSASADRSVRVWDAVEGRCMHVLEGHARPVLALAACDTFLFSGSYDHSVRVWDMATMRCVKTLSGAHALAPPHWRTAARAPQHATAASRCGGGHPLPRLAWLVLPRRSVSATISVCQMRAYWHS